MNCREVRKLLPLYREGEMAEAIRQQVHRHVESCKACEGELRDMGRVGDALAALRSVGPRLYDEDALTERILGQVASTRDRDHRGVEQFLPPSFRRMETACTLAAAALVAAFFVQNIYDMHRVAALESRLNQSPRATAVVPLEPHLSAAGLGTIAEIAASLSEPSAAQGINVRVWQQVRDVERSLFDVLRDGRPGVADEVLRLREKYPELWTLSPTDGLGSHDRRVLDREGKALLKDLRPFMQEGEMHHEE
jgi:hypothetical protein